MTDETTEKVKDTIDADAQRMYLQGLLDSGCKFLFRTIIVGKPYVWVESPAPEKSIFLERIPMEDLYV